MNFNTLFQNEKKIDLKKGLRFGCVSKMFDNLDKLLRFGALYGLNVNILVVYMP